MFNKQKKVFQGENMSVFFLVYSQNNITAFFLAFLRQHLQIILSKYLTFSPIISESATLFPEMSLM